jgi:hypothetical protein
LASQGLAVEADGCRRLLVCTAAGQHFSALGAVCVPTRLLLPPAPPAVWAPLPRAPRPRRAQRGRVVYFCGTDRGSSYCVHGRWGAGQIRSAGSQRPNRKQVRQHHSVRQQEVHNCQPSSSKKSSPHSVRSVSCRDGGRPGRGAALPAAAGAPGGLADVGVDLGFWFTPRTPCRAAPMRPSGRSWASGSSIACACPRSQWTCGVSWGASASGGCGWGCGWGKEAIGEVEP